MILYVITRGLIRTSIIVFYVRVFPPSFNVKINRLVIFTGFLNVLLVLGFLVAIVFQCDPINYFWHQWDSQSSVQGRCLPLQSLFWAGSATGITFDLWLIVLPMPGIWKLDLSRRARLLAGIMLSFGLL